jgi:cell division protein FtsB
MAESPDRAAGDRTVPKGGADSHGRRVLRLVLALVTVILLIDAMVGEKGLIALFEARREHAAVERSLLRARTDNARLREEARRLREDPAAIEELARRDLGMIKPGETLFIIREVQPRK